MKIGDQIEPKLIPAFPGNYATWFHAQSQHPASPRITYFGVVYQIAEILDGKVAVARLIENIRDRACPTECIINTTEWQPRGAKVDLNRPEGVNAG